MRGLLVGVILVLAACGQQLPAPECDPDPAFAGVALTCEVAVAAAVGTLPADHPAIKRIQFIRGASHCCRALLAEAVVPPLVAHVVFTFAGTAQRQQVRVEWQRGTLTAGSLTPWLP